MTDKYELYHQQLNFLKENHQFRELIDLNISGKYVQWQDSKLINLASNDYLGLASDSELQKEFISRLASQSQNPLFSASSSRLLTGNHLAYGLLEKELAQAFQREACIIFNSGYHTNIGILPALTDKKDLILADKLIHASIIDGLRLSDATCKRYRHLDYGHLYNQLKKHRHLYQQVFIVTESIFSMDGDLADIAALVKIKKEFNAFLYVDEAHSFGTLGANGLGLCESLNLINDVDLLIGTFGKALGSLGAFLICDNLLKDYLINHARSFIFTTGLAPVNILWSHFLFSKLASWQNKREHLSKLGHSLREGIKQLGGETLGESNIVPLIIRNSPRCIELANALKEKGFWAMPIRHPTVSKGNERVRFSLRADLSLEDIQNLINIMKEKYIQVQEK